MRVVPVIMAMFKLEVKRQQNSNAAALLLCNITAIIMLVAGRKSEKFPMEGKACVRVKVQILVQRMFGDTCTARTGRMKAVVSSHHRTAINQTKQSYSRTGRITTMAPTNTRKERMQRNEPRRL